MHVPRRQKLSFLDIDTFAGLGGGNQKVGLAAKEGWYLQYVQDFGSRLALFTFVHIGEHRQPQFFLDLGEHFQPFL
ncbi:MAG: hypothetical protein BWY75_03679 [bacterium ADurb.Bin425]|nr:MAG: hypothetical protein BWY75_03679 [bacterium ADurb.Bin425]